MADSDSEVSFESADEGETEREGGDVQTGDEKKADGERTDRNQGIESHQPEATDGAADLSRTLDSGDSLRIEDAKGGETENKVADNDQARDSSRTAESDPVKDKVGKAEGRTMDSGGDAANKSAIDTRDDKDEKGEELEPVGEVIQDRGSTETSESDARAGGAPANAVPSSSGGSWGWGGWGTSLLSSAAATVTKVSDNVGKGLTSVLENVESSLGVPKPEELSEIEKQEAVKAAAEKTEKPQEPDDQPTKEPSETGEIKDSEEKAHGAAGLGGFFTLGASALTNVMEKTVTGGLDALEAIGRKTMDILQEGDPRLEKARSLILPKRDKPVLSEVLRQAKEEAEVEAARRQEEEEHQKYNFTFLFDQFQGLVHLEALEMLSNQSETKVQASIAMVTEEDLEEVKTELMEIRDAFQMEDVDSLEEDSTNEQDFVNVITELLFSLSVAVTPDKLQRAEKEAKDWLSAHSADKTDLTESDEELQVKNIHARALRTLAELTSRTIEQFHKVAELMLLDEEKAEERSRLKSAVESATTLSKLASILTAELSCIATRFCELLTSLKNPSDEASPVITNIYLEASNSTSYIQDAFQLLLPVMQDIAVRRRNATSATT